VNTPTPTPRILFLDFDGVINEGRKAYPFTSTGYAIERRLAQRVGRMVRAVDAQVVISSDWRHHYSRNELSDILAEYGGIDRARVLGVTDYQQIRGEEIQTWLQQYARDARVAILDDNDQGRFNMDVVRRWFVGTDGDIGVQPTDIRKAAALLTRGEIWTPRSASVVVAVA
jgi:hypothetical protein